MPGYDDLYSDLNFSDAIEEARQPYVDATREHAQRRADQLGQQWAEVNQEAIDALTADQMLGNQIAAEFGYLQGLDKADGIDSRSIALKKLVEAWKRGTQKGIDSFMGNTSED